MALATASLELALGGCSGAASNGTSSMTRSRRRNMMTRKRTTTRTLSRLRVWDARITAAITTIGRRHGHHLRHSLGDLSRVHTSHTSRSCSKYSSTHAFRQRTRGELGETQLLSVTRDLRRCPRAPARRQRLLACRWVARAAPGVTPGAAWLSELKFNLHNSDDRIRTKLNANAEPNRPKYDVRFSLTYVRTRHAHGRRTAPYTQLLVPSIYPTITKWGC